MVLETPRNATPALAGLVVAWGGTALLISPAARGLDDPQRPWAALLGQALFWLLAAAVVAIVLFWERQPLRSLWLRPFRWQSLVWGLLLVVLHWTVLAPTGEWLRRAFGLSGFAAGMEGILRFSFGHRVLAVLGAGIVEEILFRGFTVTRLILLTDRPWLAATLTLVGFGLLHVPVWGWGFVVGGLVSGIVGMAFFLWRKDLLAMIVFHTVGDAIGIVVAPAFSDWWRQP